MVQILKPENLRLQFTTRVDNTCGISRIFNTTSQIRAANGNKMWRGAYDLTVLFLFEHAVLLVSCGN